MGHKHFLLNSNNPQYINISMYYSITMSENKTFQASHTPTFELNQTVQKYPPLTIGRNITHKKK